MQKGRFKPSEVLIDNQANISIVHPSLLRDVQRADHEVKINGVAGHQFSVNQTGFLDPLVRVYASEKTQANILSLSEVENRYLVTFVPQECFIIHLPQGGILNSIRLVWSIRRLAYVYRSAVHDCIRVALGLLIANVPLFFFSSKYSLSVSLV